MKIVIDDKLARAIGWDAGNRSMRAAGREKWNEDDYNAGVRAMDDCLPDPKAGK